MSTENQIKCRLRIKSNVELNLTLRVFFPSTLVFLLLQIPLSRQDLSRRAIEHKPLARKNRQPLLSQLMLNKEVRLIMYLIGSHFIVYNLYFFHLTRLDYPYTVFLCFIV